ncbi:hypothetical protein H6G76_18110 [Nostoc sp. FACHB-152]|uniref:hypothetical protein n=1 Tax=unclassified Nostoc TaxID=2593658 RepID=UPI0016862F19|nr:MULTISPECIES: hypothetical protein [unclassified Nostoc]MBD2449034.1 hypothetical protein [Nostoc sp. FACHB-152]MBD2469765.1 hypothetical protein [Nostoc sp. FACHB-145]
MQVHYKKLFCDLAFWLITEFMLNLVGLDDLANYSEFIFFKESLDFSSYPDELAVKILPKGF